ncbi:MAG: hypothetical protein ABR924_18685 [Terracidiphilus sp.]|jgi:hypothetical protein
MEPTREVTVDWDETQHCVACKFFTNRNGVLTREHTEFIREGSAEVPYTTMGLSIVNWVANGVL